MEARARNLLTDFPVFDAWEGSRAEEHSQYRRRVLGLPLTNIPVLPRSQACSSDHTREGSVIQVMRGLRSCGIVGRNTYGERGGSRALWWCERRIQHVDLSDARKMAICILASRTIHGKPVAGNLS